MNSPSLSLQRRSSAWLMTLLCALVAIIVAVVTAGYMTLRASLPQLDGTHVASALSATVAIERDALGVPTLQGSTRTDVAFGTGFVQAQDRFFQMDLLRRVAAGEMSELVGPAALELARRNPPHRLPERPRMVPHPPPPPHPHLLARYTARF